MGRSLQIRGCRRFWCTLGAGIILWVALRSERAQRRIAGPDSSNRGWLKPCRTWRRRVGREGAGVPVRSAWKQVVLHDPTWGWGEHMSRIPSVFECQSCGYSSSKWLGRCPDCGNWNSFVEGKEITPTKRDTALGGDRNVPVALSEISTESTPRVSTANEESTASWQEVSSPVH